ncbi:hypothetical protein H7J86_32160 [Mycobacterium hackensackense]|uniref:hypothetical protein n=1 Tax=Mycobacterium hackensackense TaxID=228909 RepID=UPI002265C0C6|nr:hypothetical protein [Mycobacterium hackensackense]MCV7256840.1 hypothetical protein [Mycobacterium hackensackense]
MTRRTTNTLLCDVFTTPDGNMLTIEDPGAAGHAGTYVHADLDSGTALEPLRALWVHTMGAHECDQTGRRVRVRVLAGTDRLGLGTLVFDGQLTIGSGILAIGDARSPDRHLLVGPPSTVNVSVFAEYVVELLHFEDPDVGYPVSGPSDITVLLGGDPGITYIGPGTERPWWRRLGRWKSAPRRGRLR